MSEQAASEWEGLRTSLGQFTNHLNRSNSVNVNSQALLGEAKAFAQQYFRRVRPVFIQIGMNDEVAALDPPIQSLFQLADGLNAASSYKKNVATLRKAIPGVSSVLEMKIGDGLQNAGATATQTEVQITGVLEKLVPTAALSYRQAIADLKDDKRMSYRGPAVELRETLREVLDHLAPDADVVKSPGFKLEKDRPKPTMRQKVRFILRAREESSANIAAPEDTTNTIEGLIGKLTRTVYDLGSVATHVASERRDVMQLKRYVEAVLHDILAL